MSTTSPLMPLTSPTSDHKFRPAEPTTPNAEVWPERRRADSCLYTSHFPVLRVVLQPVCTIRERFWTTSPTLTTWRWGPCPRQLPPIVKEGGVYSGGGGVKSRRKEGARRGQRAQPRQRSGGVAPGVTRNARSASGRIRSRGSGGAEDDTPTPSASPRRGGASGKICSRGHGGAEGNPPTPSVPPGRADFGAINGNSGSRVSSSSSSSRDSSSRTSSNTSTSRGDVPTLAGREAYRQKWDGKIPALQGGRTRSQSKKHQMDADTADALLTHAWRTEEEETTTERVHDLLLEEWLEKLERRGIGPRARGVRGCRVGRQGK